MNLEVVNRALGATVRKQAADLRAADVRIQQWRLALMNIAQGKGDPVALACRALEADNGN